MKIKTYGFFDATISKVVISYIAQVKKIILLADDDADDQQLLSEALAETDDRFILHAVSSAKEVMAYLIKDLVRMPHLIILDYNMPDNNGAEILDMIKSREALKDIPILIWSTSDSTIYKRLCEEKGAMGYFQKPNSFKGLLDITNKMISYAM